MGSTPHLPWAAAAPVVSTCFGNRRLGDAYPHLVSEDVVALGQFWHARYLEGPGGGTTTNVWCCFCGEEYAYGGAVDVKAYLWASKHACRARTERGPVQGEECTRLFR